MTKTSWQTGNLKMNEDWVNPSGTCFVPGWNWREDVLTAEIEELEKLDASETYPRRLNAKEVLITHKDGEFVFLVADGSAKLSGRDYEFQEPTVRRESAEKRENLSGESHGDREEFELEESEDDAEARKTFGLFKDTSFIVIILSREFNLRAERRIIPYFTRFTLLNESVDIAGKYEILYPITTLRKNSFRWKDLKKAFHLISLLKVKASTLCLVSQHSVIVRQISSSYPGSQGSARYSQVWTWEERSTNSECCSDQWTSGSRELRMIQTTLEICLSEALASGNREAQTKDLSTQAMLIPDAKATMEKEWKDVIQKAHKNKRQGKSTLLHWWTSAISKSTSTSRRMFAGATSSVDTSASTSRWMFARAISSVENIKPRWRSCTRTSREDRWNRNKGRKF